MSDQDRNDLLTIPEAAEMLRVSAVTVSRWLKQGRLPSYRVGPRAVRIRRVDIDQVLAPAVATEVAAFESERSAGSGPISPASEPDSALPSREERIAVNDEVMALRDRILARRKGQTFASAADDLSKTRQKRGKRQ
ncbi:MAG TPA: helix-turn-helix domain-containing protein [Thermomicrobiales bacterium]|nr:helix-turn-helix domain-containing protein [Thermomicrobiales bacterium]